MNDENRYEPYQYGAPNTPHFEEPDLDPKKDEESNAQNDAYAGPQYNEPQFAEPDLDEEIRDNTFSYHDDEEHAAPQYDYQYTQTTQSQVQGQPKRKNGCLGKVFGVVALAVVFGIVTCVAFQATNGLFGRFFKAPTQNTTGQSVNSTQIGTNSGSTVVSDVADVAENVMPAVVSVTNMSIQEVQNFFGGVTQYESTSTGSGIIIGQNDSELLVVSNNHVVEGSKSLTVTFIDETSVEAQIKGTDSDMDLAIIAVPLSEIKKDTLDAIKVATLGDSDALRVGEPTIAIGNALGYGQSVTSGIVSALERTIEDFEGELIQTDAAINPGNSGGALLNANGEVIGINTAKVSADAVEGMGYAIPISDVTDILNELMNKETRTKVPESQRGSIGIYGRTVDSQMSDYYNMPEGVYIVEVIEGGGADKANVPTGCYITEIDGTGVDTMEELQEQLQYYRAGETVEFTIAVPKEEDRKVTYVEKTVEITLGKAQ